MRPERPIVLFPEPGYAPVDKMGPTQKQTFASHEKQVSKLKPQFKRLQEELERGRIIFTKYASDIDPEFTVVFEIVGNIQTFETAIRNLQKNFQEVELLSDSAGKNISPEDYYDDGASDSECSDDSDGNDNNVGEFDIDSSSKKLRTKMFLVSASSSAVNQIVSLWNHYSLDEHYKFPRGLTGFRDLFRTLHSVHKWGISERLVDSGILEDWSHSLQDSPNEMIKIQIELFFTKSDSKRKAREKIVRDVVFNSGGTILDRALIPEIAYHALLAEIPRQYALDIYNEKEVELVMTESVMFLKSCAQTVFPVIDESEIPDIDFDYNAVPKVVEPPLIALFDGFPQYNHPLLKGLLEVDDPDKYGTSYAANQMIHGTSMASLILRGFDMSKNSGSFRKLYVRPLMKFDSNYGKERTPDDFLLIRKFYEAISRLFDSNPDLHSAPPRAPSVRIVNLSLGIEDRQFYGIASPWARLIDWLSYKYGILFIVSAGNHCKKYDIDIGINFEDFKQLPTFEKDKYVIKNLSRTLNSKHLLSPAESINALTVGSSFFDNNNQSPVSNNTELCSDHMPALYSSFDYGTAGCIKPDILYPGGRKFVFPHPIKQQLLGWRESTTRKPGVCSAAPFSATGSRCSVSYSFGTSCSTALVSHQAQECFEILNHVLTDKGGTGVPREFTAVLIKAMLVHGASWNALGSTFKCMLGLSGHNTKRILHKYLGYGEPDIDMVKECTKDRITFFGYGEFSKEGAFIYQIPVPFDFHESKLFRRLTVTLAYLSPVNSGSGKYRNKKLWFSVQQKKTLFEESVMYDHYMIVKGTLQHQVFSGKCVQAWRNGRAIDIKINATGWDSNRDCSTVRYALFATFGLAPNCGVDVYQEVLNKIAVKPVTRVKV